MNVVDVIPVYDIISSSILNRPYSFGNPFVLGTVIVSSVDEISDEIVVLPTMTSGTKLSGLISVSYTHLTLPTR